MHECRWQAYFFIENEWREKKKWWWPHTTSFDPIWRWVESKILWHFQHWWIELLFTWSSKRRSLSFCRLMTKAQHCLFSWKFCLIHTPVKYFLLLSNSMDNNNSCCCRCWVKHMHTHTPKPTKAQNLWFCCCHFIAPISLC